MGQRGGRRDSAEKEQLCVRNASDVSDNEVIDPNYPSQFFPYLYPHLYPHLFPHLYPHYAKEYKAFLKNKKEKKEKRPTTAVLQDRRNVMMSKKEFLSYRADPHTDGIENGGINKLGKREEDGIIDELEIRDHFKEKQDSQEKGRDGIAGNPPTKQPSMNASSTVLKGTNTQMTSIRLSSSWAVERSTSTREG